MFSFSKRFSPRSSEIKKSIPCSMQTATIWASNTTLSLACPWEITSCKQDQYRLSGNKSLPVEQCLAGTASMVFLYHHGKRDTVS